MEESILRNLWSLRFEPSIKIFIARGEDPESFKCARAIAQFMKRKVGEVMSEDDVLTSQNWQDQIEEMLYAANVVIILLTASAEKKGKFARQMQQALELQKTHKKNRAFVLFLIEPGITPPEELTSWQKIQAWDDDTGKQFNRVFASV